MPATRTPAADTGHCALVTGHAECRCAELAPFLTDDEIVERATEKFRWQQRASAEGRVAARRGLDRLLGHVRDGGSAAVVSDLLRMTVLVRIVERDPRDAGDVADMLHLFTRIAELSGDPVALGEAAALRAHRSLAFGLGEDALAEAATAVAILTDIIRPLPGQDQLRWVRHLSRSLNALVLVLLALGAHELADEVSQRAIAAGESGGTAMDRLVHQLNRVRLQLSWALRLERAGRDAAAATRFVGAAQTAHAAAALWGPALGRAPGEGPSPAAECPVIAAAYALQRPCPHQLDLLAAVVPLVHLTEDRIVLAIATARCRLNAGRTEEAAAGLAALQAELAGGRSDAVPALALHREVARVDGIARGEVDRPEALARYASALEEELWAMREARLTALRSHSAHQRLAREHGAVAAQALQDPLTSLPNRRALDRRLAEATRDPASQPCAVALVDLDRFKDVNDARSHAAGDAVLREVAHCLRAALRAQDMVARYGGDEFVVVMPATPLSVARAALLRATEAVAALPPDVGAGVTMSVGVVRAVAGAPAASLAAADAAMYRAKRSGGDTVVIGAVETGRDAAPPASGGASDGSALEVPAQRGRSAQEARSDGDREAEEAVGRVRAGRTVSTARSGAATHRE